MACSDLLRPIFPGGPDLCQPISPGGPDLFRPISFHNNAPWKGHLRVAVCKARLAKLHFLAISGGEFLGSELFQGALVPDPFSSLNFLKGKKKHINLGVLLPRFFVAKNPFEKLPSEQNLLPDGLFDSDN